MMPLEEKKQPSVFCGDCSCIVKLRSLRANDGVTRAFGKRKTSQLVHHRKTERFRIQFTVCGRNRNETSAANSRRPNKPLTTQVS